MIKGVPMNVHENFRDIIKDIVFERQKEGIDEKGKPISFCDLTKIFTNMINANPKIKQAIIEVKINGKL